MKKVNISRKIIMGIGATAMTVIALGTSTYAWFARNGDAVVEKTNFNLESAEGLRISLDGEHFSQDITLSQLKEVIKANTGKDYEDLKYSGVTLKYDENGKVQYDATTGFPLFQKDSVALREDTYRDVKYNHEYVDAVKSDYLSFDLYFQVDFVGQTLNEDYDLWFAKERSDTGEATGIYGKETTVKLHNGLSTMTGSYTPNEEITYSPVNAMRLAVKNQTDSNLIVYEQEIGLGSKAVDNFVYKKAEITEYADGENYLVKTGDSYDYVPVLTNFVSKNTDYYTYDGTNYTYVDKSEAFDATKTYYVKYANDKYSLVHLPFDGSLEYYTIDTNSVDSRFDPMKNAMYTYYNNNHPYERFDDSINPLKAAKYNEETITPQNGLSVYEQSKLASFEKDANGYKVIKMSFTFWLEGWDADFLEMTEESATDFNISLAFELRAR